MLLIDQYSYFNRLNHIHPIEKISFTMLMLFFSLIVRDFRVSLAVFFISSIFILLAKIPFRFYIKLLLLPLTFIFLSLFPIILNISYGKVHVGERIWDYSIGNFYFYVNMSSINTAFDLFMISIGSLGCLYLLILTTPLVEILFVLKKWRVSPLLIEIIAITYRFLFALIDTAAVIFHSQTSRLGYSSFRKGILSFGYLASALFLKSYQRASKLHQAVESRGGYGEFMGEGQTYTFSLQSWSMIAVVISFLVLLFSF